MNPTPISEDIRRILLYLHSKRGFDFSGYNPQMLNRRIQLCISQLQLQNSQEYLNYLTKNEKGLDELIDKITIHISHFFRDPLYFEFLYKHILPKIVHSKPPTEPVRIWCAGCAEGEEAYSLAILLHEISHKEKRPVAYSIFATDIDQKVLKKAKRATFSLDKLDNVRKSWLDKYFEKQGEHFAPVNSISSSVRFHEFDLLNKNHNYPPESIYGSFDLVLCRNVLIYMGHKQQSEVFLKLRKSMSSSSFLMLGEAEEVHDNYTYFFNKPCQYLKIYAYDPV